MSTEAKATEGTATSANADAPELDLEAQLEALLAEIEAREPDVVVRSAQPAAPAPQATLRDAGRDPEPDPGPESAADPEPAPVEAAAAEPVAAETVPEAPAADVAPITGAATFEPNATSDAAPAPSDPPARDMLDELGDQIAQLFAEASGAKESAADPAETASLAAAAEPVAAPTEAAAPDTVDGAAPPEPPAAPTLTEDDLASQLQALLDAARPDASSAVPAEPVAVAAPVDGPDREGVLAGAFEAPEPVTESVAAHEEPPAVEPPVAAAAPTASAAPQSIEEIDAALAEEADHAVAGEFETIQDVLETPPAAPPPQATPAGVTPAVPEPVAEVEATADEELAGGFEAPEDLLEEDVQTLAEAPAERPIHLRPTVLSASQADEPEEPAAPSRKHRLRLPMPPLPSPIVVDAVYHGCRVVNAPLARLSPEMRSTVGYIAVMNLAISLGLVIYGLFN